MSRAYKCDHCHGYFDSRAGRFRWDGDVCDAKAGFVRYRVIALLFDSSGPPTAYQGGIAGPHSPPIHLGDKGNREFCDDCILAIAKAALAEKKL